MKPITLLVALLGLTACGSAAKSDVRVVELHRLHKQLDSTQVAVTVPQLQKLNFPAVTDDEVTTVNRLLAESKQNLATLDAFNASQADQLTALIKQENTVLSKVQQMQTLSVQEARNRASEAALIRLR